MIAALLVMILGMLYVIDEGPYRLWSVRVKRNISENREDYRVVSFVIFDYKYILNQMTSFREEKGNDAVTVSNSIATHLDSFYRSTGRISYEGTYFDDNYTPEHMESFRRMQEDLEAALSVYCHLTKEEVAALADYSVVKRAALIEEGLHRETDEGGKEAGEE